MSSNKLDACLIIDIGKTNIKCVLLDELGQTLWSRSQPNISHTDKAYPYFDLDGIWQWLQSSLHFANTIALISAINISTHGACAVLIDEQGELVLPVLDYEHPIPEDISQQYDAIRPDFTQTLSPNLPLGLNLGRQLFWLQQQYPVEFARTHHVLMYPQYWVWRLTGQAVTEVTSLGCHTDLWLPAEQTYSSLLDELVLRSAMPPIKTGYEVVGGPTDEVCQSTGLSANCRIYSGVHDSNAGFARYLYSIPDRPVTLVSMGTWVICMTTEQRLKNLQECRDTLGNVSVAGNLLPCARFMGGREFEQICQLTNSDMTGDYQPDDIQQLIDDGVFALPPFSQSGGPFAGREGRIIGKPASGSALASLYLALMIDYQLDLLGVIGDVIFGSASRKNPLMCQLLAQLRPRQRILLSGDSAGTVVGAWCLTRWQQAPDPSLTQFDIAKATNINGLLIYRDRWRDLSEQIDRPVSLAG
ncbi:FGGY-family carbohydrate kinase [Neptunicella sp. SCSIO 80796]|uniref:FGGY-family carbohydrate kinase n=1 Tax=Neptunicella plasticusilytica TaxID=3117012 RepID=UPI003A4DB66F